MFNNYRGDDKRQQTQLVEAFRKGEEWAFAEIYRQQKRSVMHFLLPRVKDRETARDLMQEVFLKAHRFCTSYQSEYPLSVWVRTIARNTLADWFRSNRTRALSAPASPHPENGDETSAAEQLASPDPSPEHQLQRKIDRKQLRMLLKRLTQAQRRVVWMRLIQERSYAEIARALGMSLDAVKCLSYRSRQALVVSRALPA